MSRSASYRPTPNGIDCPHEGKHGPCWGEVLLIDEQHTESDAVHYYACEGHAAYAMYGRAQDYRAERTDDAE